MKNNTVILSILFLLLLAENGDSAENIPLTSIAIHPNTEFVIFGTRHGNRNPEEYITGINRTWGQEGSLELTSIGKRQAYGLGVELRNFIKNLTTYNYNSSEVKYYSSSSNRCQMTLQVAVAGIHPPESWGDWNPRNFNHWGPIPYTIDDKMLRMYSVKECTKSDQVWEPIDKDQLSNLKKMRSDNEIVLKYLGQHTGWNMSKSLGVVADLADNILQMDFYNTTYPQWLEHPSLSGYNGISLKNKIMEFAEIHPRSCAYYEPCRDLMAGYWLEDVLNKLNDASTNKNHLKLVGYASHTEITLSVMKLMGIEKEEVTTSAGFVIEFRKSPSMSIRLLNHDPNPIDRHVIYKSTLSKRLRKYQDADGFIPLKDFISEVKENAYSNWKSECGIAGCDSNSSSSNFVILPLVVFLIISIFKF